MCWAYLYQVLALGDSAYVSLWQIALLALLCAPLSVLGDLFASIIKRQSGVKISAISCRGTAGLWTGSTA